MANQIEKYYSSFAGIDTRSNKLLQDPKTFRKGSKNFRYNFQDEIQNAQGFQHKDNGAPNFVDQFEYKYRDVNTGQALTQLLGVATDGNLYRRKNHWLKFVSHGAATSVSMIYDEEYDTYKMILTGLGSVTISKTMQLATGTTAGLVGALNALGITTKIVDDDGADVATSTKLAYLLDCVVEDTTFVDNPVYFWEVVPFPNAASVPFNTTKNYYTSSDYEGISSVNLFNAIYMTDGGFPMKYDGKCVYRAGVPNLRSLQNNGATIQNFSGVDNNLITDQTIVSTGLASGKYGWKYRFAFRDYNGAEYFSNLTATSVLQTVSASFQAAKIGNIGYKFGKDFAVFGCVVSSSTATTTVGGTGADGSHIFTIDTVLDRDYNYTNITVDNNVTVHLNGFALKRTGTITMNAGGSILNSVTSRTSTSVTFNVLSGHNLVVGQSLVLRTSSTGYLFGSSFFDGYYYAKITGKTATSVTIDKPAMITNIVGSEVINSYWVPTEFENAKETAYTVAPFGPSLEIFRTFVNQVTDVNVGGPFYLVGHSALPYDGSVATSYFVDDRFDAALPGLIYEDLTPGSELPRACKYVSQAQGQLVQAGLPLNYSDKDIEYPSSLQAITSTTGPYNAYPNELKYTEAMFCDFQSVYWADSLSPEGFTQDGVHEISIDTKFADRIKAVAPNKDALFAFKERSTAVISGSFATNDVNLEVLEADCGCVSHKTVEDVRGYLIWLDKVNGFYSCVAGRLPENIGFPIQDYQKINALKLDYTKASAANFRKESLYVCSVDNTTFVFDYADNGNLKRNCWYIWDRIIGKSVLATSDDKLLIWDGTRTWKMKITHTNYDYTDDTEAIPLILNTAWLSQGFPSIDKHYVGLWINSIQGDFTLTVNQYGNFLEDLVGSQSNVEFIAESSSKKFVKTPVKASIPKLSSISFGMENNEKNKWVRIQGYEVQYSADFNTGEPKR